MNQMQVAAIVIVALLLVVAVLAWRLKLAITERNSWINNWKAESAKVSSLEMKMDQLWLDVQRANQYIEKLLKRKHVQQVAKTVDRRGR